MVLHARQYADHVVVIDDGSKDRTSEVAKYAVLVFSFGQKGMAIEGEMLIEASRAYLRINEVSIAVK